MILHAKLKLKETMLSNRGDDRKSLSQNMAKNRALVFGGSWKTLAGAFGLSPPVDTEDFVDLTI